MRFYHSRSNVDVEVEHLTIAGWTGRNTDAVAHHIAELAELGVSPPSQVPLFYRVSHSLLTQADVIEVLGEATSGEVEPLLLNCGSELWLGLGSDHTDRDLEAVAVAASKQACPKPLAASLWRFDDVAPHLDDLILRCHIKENGEWTLYQDGTLAQIARLESLAERAGLAKKGAMLCGTLPAIGVLRPASAYRMALIDPVRDETITLDYRVRPLEIVT